MIYFVFLLKDKKKKDKEEDGGEDDDVSEFYEEFWFWVNDCREENDFS